MSPADFQKRTKAYGLRIIRLVESDSGSFVFRHIANQLMRSGTSVGANYRAACRAKSNADFISKMGIVEEECDETLYWMEMLVDAGLIRWEANDDLFAEGNEILAMVVSSIRTTKSQKVR